MSAAPPPPAGAHPSPLGLALSLAPGTLLAGIAGGIVFPIFPIVGREVGLSLAFIGAILAANRATRVVASPFVGMLADRIGGRRTLLIGLAVQIAVIGLYLLGLATHHEGAGFLIGRLLHGPASGCVFVSAQALALEAATSGQGGSSAGVVRAAIVLGIPVGFIVGGILSGAIGVEATFAVAAGAVCVALAAAFVSVPELHVHVAKRAPIGAQLQAMADRRLLALGALNFALAFAASGTVLTTLALLVSERGFSVFGRNAAGTSGILMAIMSIVDAVTTPFVGRLGDRYRSHGAIAAASVLVVVLGLALIGAAANVPLIAAGIALIGLGCAGLGPSVLVILGAITPRERRGANTGLLQLCADAGGVAGPLVGTAVFASSTTAPFFVSAAVMLCFFPVALTLIKIERALALPISRPR